MNLWELTNTVVNYEVDKHLLDSGFERIHCNNAFTKFADFNYENYNIRCNIYVSKLYSNNLENGFNVKLRIVSESSKHFIEKQYSSNITLDEFKKLGDELIADFIDKLRR